MAVKRRASVSVNTNASKKRKVLKHCSAIEKVLQDAEHLPVRVRKMLCSNLPACVGVAKEDRHDYQHKVVAMIGEVLAQIRSEVQKTIDHAEGKLNDTTKEKVSRTEAYEAATTILREKKDALESAKTAYKESQVASKAAKSAFAAAEAVLKTCNKDIEQDSCQRNALEAALQDSFTSLRDGTAPGDNVNSAVATMSKIATELGLEQSLLVALPSTLKSPVSARGDFDGIVFDELEKKLKNRINEVAEKVASGERRKAESTSVVEGASRELESAVAKESACKEAVEASTSALGGAQQAEKEASKALSQFEPDMRQAAKDADAARARLESINSGALAAFEELLELSFAVQDVEREGQGQSSAGISAEPAAATEA